MKKKWIIFFVLIIGTCILIYIFPKNSKLQIITIKAKRDFFNNLEDTTFIPVTSLNNKINGKAELIFGDSALKIEGKVYFPISLKFDTSYMINHKLLRMEGSTMYVADVVKNEKYYGFVKEEVLHEEIFLDFKSKKESITTITYGSTCLGLSQGYYWDDILKDTILRYSIYFYSPHPDPYFDMGIHKDFGIIKIIFTDTIPKGTELI